MTLNTETHLASACSNTIMIIASNVLSDSRYHGYNNYFQSRYMHIDIRKTFSVIVFTCNASQSYPAHVISEMVNSFQFESL